MRLFWPIDRRKSVWDDENWCGKAGKLDRAVNIGGGKRGNRRSAAKVDERNGGNEIAVAAVVRKWGEVGARGRCFGKNWRKSSVAFMRCRKKDENRNSFVFYGSRLVKMGGSNDGRRRGNCIGNEWLVFGGSGKGPIAFVFLFCRALEESSTLIVFQKKMGATK